MKNQDQIVQEELRKLIKKSCAQPTTDNYNFQKSLLKFFFKAVDVTIDYDKSTISLWTSSSSRPLHDKLYQLKDAVSVKISYTNLEETLKGCLENGPVKSRFYKSLLYHYNNVEQEIANSAISA